jgi:hypothetical protein
VKKTFVACALLCANLPASAKDNGIKLSEADAATLQGKTLALTVHERPNFMAMTAGKAMFAMVGAGAMALAGDKLVDDNHVADPARLIQIQLADLLRDADGMQPMAQDTTPTKAENARELATSHPKADYVLDVRSTHWNFAYFPFEWGQYWIGYSVEVQLVDTKSGRQISSAYCSANTQTNKNPPSREQIEGNGAQLLKDVTTALAWTCVQSMATDPFQFPAAKIPATPAEYVDPLSALAKTGASAAPDASPSATTGASQATPNPEAAGSASSPAVSPLPPAAASPSTPAPTPSGSAAQDNH